MTDRPTPQPDENVSPRTPVRIKVYGGSLHLLPPGTAWRIERITEHVQPTGVIGEVMPEWTIIDLQPIEREASSPALDVERALAAIEAMKVPGHEHLNPMDDWISVGVVRSILEGRHPILARLAHPDSDGDAR